ncbi:hypothetical protein [Helicobacter mesocricetorum]|uniref:hypothetical protein n=1 Tax=Helicobacter mesocricetorum TaxID=87012 RepID=UPI000CF0A560|nr:hypothetical protein [Helicobacter mesocricetorum]
MEQKTSESGKDEDLYNFFWLYKVFLEIDSFASITYGRNRSLIQSFYNFYFTKANKDDKDKYEEAKNKLKAQCKEYFSKNGYLKIYKFDPKTNSRYPHIVTNPNISEAFKEFAEATAQYVKWRECLSPKQIKRIYIANLKDRQKYYASNDDSFKVFNKEIIKKLM